MKFFSLLSIKKQIRMLIGLVIVAFILTQLLYYFQFFFLTQDRARVYTSNTMNQLSDSIKSNAQNIQQVAYMISYNKYIQEFLFSDDAYRRIQLRNFINDIFVNLQSTNKNIYDIYIIDNEERGLYYAATNKFPIYSELNKEYGYSSPNFTKPLFSSLLAYNNKPNINTYLFAYIMPIYLATEGADPNKKIGTCIILCNTDFIQENINSLNMPENSLFAIVDSQKKIIAANNADLRAQNFDQSMYGKYSTTKVNNSLFKDYMFQNEKVDQLDWTLTSIISIYDLTHDMDPIRNSIIAISLLFTVIIVIIGFVLSRNVANPVHKIAQFMKSFGSNEDRRLMIKEKNEIGQLSNDINHMLDKIDDINNSLVDTQKKLFTAKLTQKQTELNALQSQINPHFLYNTLDCVKSIAQVYEVEQVVQISYAMSKIFRYCIKEREFVTFREEIGCVNDYLSIMKIRFENKFKAIISIEDAIYEKKTLKMVLQPIVENAIYHGLERKYGEGVLGIKGYQSGENIFFEISDNGAGIDETHLEFLRKALNSSPDDEIGNYSNKRGIGIANINNRIRLMHGTGYGISINSKPNDGTTVILKLPVID